MDMWTFRGARGAPAHAGMPYLRFTAALSRARNVRRYLEVGVAEGRHFSEIQAEMAIGVDPRLRLACDPAAHKGAFRLFDMTSDQFFAQTDVKAVLGGTLDLAFLDGMHLYEFLLRDFANTEAVSDPGAIIVLHDCLPLNEAMADRQPQRALARGRGSAFPGFWTGDVWKLVAILRRFRPDLRLLALDCPPTGLVCVTNLDPASRVLVEDYRRILAAFDPVPNRWPEIRAMVRTLDIVSSSNVAENLRHYF